MKLCWLMKNDKYMYEVILYIDIVIFQNKYFICYRFGKCRE